MTQSRIPFVLFAVCLSAVFYVGCDSVTAVSAVAKDKKNQVEKYLKDATVLERANVQLEEAKKSRANLKEIADKFNVDAEVALRQIKRVEEEQEKSKKAFETLQNTARSAGLPKRTEATSEDLQKKIQVGTKTLTGEEIYNTLKQYKAEVQKAGDVVAREKTRSDFLKNRAASIKDKMSRVDANIDEMERQIEDYKMYQEMIAANKTLDDIGLHDDQMKQLLDTDSIMSELRKKVDGIAVEVENKDKETDMTGLKEELTGGNTGFSITDDDLL